MAITETFEMSLAYVHAFKYTISGNIVQIPGTRVRSDMSMNSLVVSANVNY